MLNPAVSLSSRSAGASSTPAPNASQGPGAPQFAQFLNEGMHGNGPDPDKAASHAGGAPTTPEDETVAAEAQGPSDTVTAQVRAARALAQRQRAGQPGIERANPAKAPDPADRAPAADNTNIAAPEQADASDATTKRAAKSDSSAESAGSAASLSADPAAAAQPLPLPAQKAAAPEARFGADLGDKAGRTQPLTTAIQQALAPTAATSELAKAPDVPDGIDASQADVPTAPASAASQKLAASTTTSAGTDAPDGAATAEPKAHTTVTRSPAAGAASRAAAANSTNTAAASDAPTTASAQAGSRDAQGPTFDQLLAMPARASQAEAGPFRADAGQAPISGFAAPPLEVRPATAPTEATASLQAPLHSAAFAPELAERVTLLTVDGVQTAQLELNPAEMGPVQIDIFVEGGRAEVTFQAAQADTRQALERALPELAGALREQGLTLAGGGVFQQSQQGGQSANAGEDGSGSSNRSGVRSAASRTSLDAIDVATAALSRRSLTPPRGLLDTFA